MRRSLRSDKPGNAYEDWGQTVWHSQMQFGPLRVTGRASDFTDYEAPPPHRSIDKYITKPPKKRHFLDVNINIRGIGTASLENRYFRFDSVTKLADARIS
jgi:hypothetical protein